MHPILDDPRTPHTRLPICSSGGLDCALQMSPLGDAENFLRRGGWLLQDGIWKHFALPSGIGIESMALCLRCLRSFSPTSHPHESDGSPDPRPPGCSGQLVDAATSSDSSLSASTPERDQERS
jgi:hypothetical protein